MLTRIAREWANSQKGLSDRALSFSSRRERELALEGAVRNRLGYLKTQAPNYLDSDATTVVSQQILEKIQKESSQELRSVLSRWRDKRDKDV